MTTANFNVEFPRRQAMVSIDDAPKYYPWQDVTVTRACKQEDVTHVPVLVWPIPTVDGDFIVEFKNGAVQRVHPDSLIFLDSAERFDQYDWTQHD